MAIGATMYRFSVALSNVDAGVFESLAFRAAQHPSESVRFFVVRVLARCLEHADGIELTRGVSDTELPALVIRDLQGQLTTWIEVGVPTAPRVHKATARAETVLVYPHKQAEQLIASLARAKLRRADRVTVVHFDETMLDALEGALARTADWAITVSDGTLYIEANGHSIVGPVHRVGLR